MADYHDEIDLWSLGRRAWQLKWFVVAVTAVLPIATAAVIHTRPQTYEATATVMVTTSQLDVILGRTPLSMDTYNQLANSEPVLEAVRRTLGEKGISSEEAVLRSNLYPSRDSAKPFFPWIALSAASPNPAHAQLIANAWAAQLISVASGLLPGDEAQRVLQGHAEAVAALSKAKSALRAVQDKHLRLNADAENTYRLQQTLLELEARRERAVALENAIVDNKASLEDVRERIAQLEREIKGGAPPGSVMAGLTEQEARERSVQSGLRAREAFLQDQLRDTRAAVGRLQKAAAETKLALARMATEQSRELEPLFRAVGDAQRRFERFDGSYAEISKLNGLPAAYVKLRNPASLPQAPQPRPYRYAVLAIPFALLASLAGVFVVAILRESHMRKLMEQAA